MADARAKDEGLLNHAPGMVQRRKRHRMGPPPLPKGKLVTAYLEGAPAELLTTFEQEFIRLIPDPNGVYALFKGKTLKYVGLTTNLHQRLVHHLDDSHAGKWDTFSVYIAGREHIKDLEAVLIHVANPPDNRTRGTLAKEGNLLPEMRRRARKLGRLTKRAG